MQELDLFCASLEAESQNVLLKTARIAYPQSAVRLLPQMATTWDEQTTMIVPSLSAMQGQTLKDIRTHVGSRLRIIVGVETLAERTEAESHGARGIFLGDSYGWLQPTLWEKFRGQRSCATGFVKQKETDKACFWNELLSFVDTEFIFWLSQPAGFLPDLDSSIERLHSVVQRNRLSVAGVAYRDNTGLITQECFKVNIEQHTLAFQFSNAEPLHDILCLRCDVISDTFLTRIALLRGVGGFDASGGTSDVLLSVGLQIRMRELNKAELLGMCPDVIFSRRRITKNEAVSIFSNIEDDHVVASLNKTLLTLLDYVSSFKHELHHVSVERLGGAQFALRENVNTKSSYSWKLQASLANTPEAQYKNQWDRDMLRLVIYFSELMNKRGIAIVIHSGTLIGAFRDGGLIPGDNDADAYINLEDVDKVSALRPQAKIDGYDLRFGSDYVAHSAKVNKQGKRIMPLGKAFQIRLQNQSLPYFEMGAEDLITQRSSWYGATYVPFFTHKIQIPAANPAAYLGWYYG